MGFPGETQKDVDELLEFIEHVRFDHLGVFTYSEEEDTFGARNFKDVTPEKVKQARAESLMDQQMEISNSLNRNKLGSIQNVIIDRKEGDYYIGRTESDSPEVDNEVILDASKNYLRLGDFAKIRINDALPFDLIGNPVTNSTL